MSWGSNGSSWSGSYWAPSSRDTGSGHGGAPTGATGSFVPARNGSDRGTASTGRNHGSWNGIRYSGAAWNEFAAGQDGGTGGYAAASRAVDWNVNSRQESAVAAAATADIPEEDVSADRWEGDIAASLEAGFAAEEAEQHGRGGETLDFLKLLPSKDWVPFGAFQLDPDVGAWGAPGGEAVDFYLKPSLMPAGGFGGWKAHPIYQKDLAFVKKDNVREIRLNKEIATRWTSSELLAFAEVRRAEFDVANVITTVHRIAKSTDRWFVKRDQRLKQVIAQAVDIICDPDRKAVARDVAKTIWAMARVNSNDRQVQDRLSEEILRRLDQFEPQGISNIMWSYARLGRPRDAILEAVLQKFRQLVGDGICEPQALSNVTWALAKMVVLNIPVLNEIAVEAVRKADEFDPQGLANITWAFATLQHEDLPMFERFGEVLAENPSRWQPQNMANLTWAYAKLLITHDRLLDAVAAETVSTIDDWNTQGLANIAWAYAKLGVHHGLLFGRIASGVLQKVSTFTPQNTVNIAWAYAKLCIAKADLMDAVAKDVIAKASDFSPQHCSNTAWAFGTAGLLNEDMMESLAGAVARGIAEFNGQDLANVAWACAKLVWSQTGMLDVMAADVTRKVSDFAPQNIAITAWSFGCLAVADEPMMTAIAEECPRCVSEFGAQGLSNLAHGFAKLGIRDVEAMETIGEEASKMLQTFTNQEFTMIAWAFAKLGIAGGPIVDAVILEMKRRLSELLPQDLATLAWSFARFGLARSKEALEELSWEITKQVADLGPQDLSNIAWAYATAGFENTMMMDALSQEVIKKVDRFTAQDLANTSWAFAKLGIMAGDMFDALAAAVTQKVATLLPQNLSIVSWSYAKLGLVNDSMMEAIAEEIMSKIEGFDGQGLGNIMWSFGVLGLREYKATVEVVMEQAIEIVEELTAQEISNLAWGLFAMEHGDLLVRFLPEAISQFNTVVKSTDGASCVDLANVAAVVAKGGQIGAGVAFVELDSFFRTEIFEPVLNALQELRDQNVDLAVAIEQMQTAVETTGAPYFGMVYTWEALARMGITRPAAWDSWPAEARRRCHDTLGQWQIPNMDSIVAFAQWDVWYRGKDGWIPVRESGRIFLSGWLEGIDEDVKELLHPFMQLTRRDMCAERVALIELLDILVQRGRADVAPASHDSLLRSCEGSVQFYLSHFPSLSSLGVFCQFRRRLPHVSLTFDFDNAWQMCCGIPRYEGID